MRGRVNAGQSVLKRNDCLDVSHITETFYIAWPLRGLIFMLSLTPFSHFLMDFASLVNTLDYSWNGPILIPFLDWESYLPWLLSWLVPWLVPWSVPWLVPWLVPWPVVVEEVVDTTPTTTLMAMVFTMVNIRMEMVMQVQMIRCSFQNRWLFFSPCNVPWFITYAVQTFNTIEWHKLMW